jgi:hypothetical protein
MSSDGPRESSLPAVGIERPRIDHSERLERLERRVLCRRIAQLERELDRERKRREQIVEQYERLLDESRTETRSENGLLDRLL